MKLDDLFAIARRTAPDKPALEFAADGQSSTLTYRQLYQAADRLAAGRTSGGLGIPNPLASQPEDLIDRHRRELFVGPAELFRHEVPHVARYVCCLLYTSPSPRDA